VKAKVEAHRYPDERMAVFHGQRKRADCAMERKEMKATEKTDATQKIQKLVTLAWAFAVTSF
jgi:hypothetical protein